MYHRRVEGTSRAPCFSTAGAKHICKDGICTICMCCTPWWFTKPTESRILYLTFLSLIGAAYLHPDNFTGWRYLFWHIFQNLLCALRQIQFPLQFHFFWKNFTNLYSLNEGTEKSEMLSHLIVKKHFICMCAYLAHVLSDTVPLNWHGNVYFLPLQKSHVYACPRLVRWHHVSPQSACSRSAQPSCAYLLHRPTSCTLTLCMPTCTYTRTLCTVGYTWELNATHQLWLYCTVMAKQVLPWLTATCQYYYKSWHIFKNFSITPTSPPR